MERRHPFDRTTTRVTLAGITLLTATATLPALGQDEGFRALRTDSRAPYVHRLNLYDHVGQVIRTGDDPARPYSPAVTCGKCHAVSTIRHGWHFNAAEPGADPGRPGEPWFYIDAVLGVVIPVTARGWPGTQRPADIGISTWDMLRRYSRHMPGGGIGTPDVGQTASSERTDRWAISGSLEVDCMFCHSADAWHDPGEWARQIERENFQWAATAALGLAVVRGEARNVPDDYDPLLGPDPDHPEQAPPTLVYDRTRFDADDRVLLDITLRPDPRRCYTCHSVRTVGAEAVPRWRGSGDVHLRAGMTCTDCHRNGIDHMIVRGYEGETLQNRSLTAEIYTCAGCHLGAAEGGQTRERLGGRLGAPVPTHRGIPPVHFEKLTCTSCHSGPWPDRSLVRVQTSFAHGLGLASRDRGDTDPPEITLPAFAVQPDGKISPRYVVWPANWGWLRIDGARAMGLELIREAVTRALPERRVADGPLSDDEIGRVLNALLPSGTDEDAPIYMRDGYAYRLDEEGKVQRFVHPAAAPYMWPLAHDVRPAAQSLGARGCRDCHAEDAPFYFGHVTIADEDRREAVPVKSMYEFQGIADPSLIRMWARAFRFRSPLLWGGIACAGLVAAVFTLYGFRALGDWLRRFE